MPPLHSLIADLPALPIGDSRRLVVPPQMRAVFTAIAAQSAEAPVLAVVPGERDADDLVDDLRLFTFDVIHLPAWETLPFEHVSPNVLTMAQRAVARHALATAGPGTVIVGSVRAVTQRVSPSFVAPQILHVGDEMDFEALVGELSAIGYGRSDRVESRGEFAVRGGIIDVFPAEGDEPVRIEFWGDEIEDIRAFSVGSQRSTDPIEEFLIYPARELRPEGEVRGRAEDLLQIETWASSTWDKIASGLSFQGLESWLPWITDERGLLDDHSETEVVIFDPSKAAGRSLELITEESDLAAALAPTWGSGAPEAGEHPPLYLPLERVLEPVDPVLAPPIPSGPGDDVMQARGLDGVVGDPESIAAALNRWTERGVRMIVAMDGEGAANRVTRLLGENGIDLPVVGAVSGERAAAISVGIHRGFVAPELGFGVVGEMEIAGRRRSHRKAVARKRGDVGDAYRDLRPGDFVVHHQHGIGRFEGLVHREIAGVERDYLFVAFRGEDRLYVPTDQLAAIRRYTGGEHPKLSKMGGADWDKTRKTVRKAVAVVAEEVIDLHRKREAAKGHAFELDTPWQTEFESAFPFEETPDQMQAIIDVKSDMESDSPMDRLVFGDVGFGKTEVALRAAFKAVQGGKQVVVLVPTTLLAQQHFANWEERLAPYPVRVEMLSRFLTSKQQAVVVRDLALGDVDIVIGTHRVLSQDVVFKDLGLVVVDEEQRFGVGAKDRLKELRTSVDMMTLTATPIPRTLEMALTGIREVSHIRTPPIDRHPILTYVGGLDNQAISAAIRREILREGQVFYVHNRVQSIDHCVVRLKELVPDARFAIAHGQMSEGQLEQVMYDFWNGDYDVLVATTIIESGLDLPQVNTLIVERADLLGLAQMYQLRGRVGRSHQRAYAYLFHPEEKTLSEDAYRRLEAIGEFSDLGSGFNLAMRDLEIRGAGSILSQTQAGHISAVGFDMYVELVANAVNKLKGDEVEIDEPPEIRIDLPVDASLPPSYVPDSDARLEAYRRLASAITPDAVADVVAEWKDRFGDLPPDAERLVDMAMLRCDSIAAGLHEIVKVRDEIRIGPVDLKESQMVRLRRIAPDAVQRGSVLFLPAPRPKRQVLAAVLEFVRRMWPAPPPTP
jgi:transcription-repair coupling factor (superfamily II helicase)